MKPWPTILLGELAGGGQYGLNAAAMAEGTGVRFIRITDISQDGELRHEEPAFVPEDTRELDDYELKDGDVLIARSGATAGKSYIHRSFGERAVFAGYLIRFQPDTAKVLPRFIGAFLQTPDYWRQLNSHKRAVAQPNVNAKQLASLILPVPPLVEQEQLVKLLDEADELRKRRAQADRRTTSLIPALFHEMFGQRIAAPPIVTSTVGLKAPREWRWAKLTDVARLATGHTPSRRHPEWWGGDIPWISLTDIRELDGTIATGTGECVNEEEIAHSSSVKLPKDTVCFSRTASVGFVTVMGREMATSQDFVNWVCGPELDPIFLMGALMQAREYLRSLASGSTHKTIYFPTVKQFATIIPPFALQKEFAARATEIRAVQAEQSASGARLNDLFQSMLHRAFNGEL